ncbi:MAG TPA: aconitate hydratase AcnA [Polyangiaceae bacterium]|nr:aconitate hydratase AcnA [Polyangiaceae bacterium]
MGATNSWGARDTLRVGGEDFTIFRLDRVPGSESLPYSLKVLLENLLRNEDGRDITAEHARTLASWQPTATPSHEIQFTPGRVLLQDFTGVPCVVDLATLREALSALGGDPQRVNPLSPVELVIDHSVIVDVAGSADAFAQNVRLEYQRNEERYRFLRWGQSAFSNFRVVPPGTGIVHQVNLEYLARVVMQKQVGSVRLAFPDTCVGTDSHTTMVNGLGVLGWGVGGIEAEAAMLGQPVSMLIPQVLGFELVGQIPAGTTATDVVLTITEMLRLRGVVGKFVEFHGEGVAAVPLANRATIGNMSPEFGSTAAMFPIDAVTLDYLKLTGRSESDRRLVEAYAKEQGLWHDPSRHVEYSERMVLDLSTVVPSLAGPKRPQDRIPLSRAKQAFAEALSQLDRPAQASKQGLPAVHLPLAVGGPPTATVAAAGPSTASVGDSPLTTVDALEHGSVVIAAITSCTNTSNPSVMMAAGLLARKAVARGLRSRPWVKTSLAPGSRVVMDYYERAGLLEPLAALGFQLVGYGCTTCIGNSGPLPPAISARIERDDLAVAAVLSGNRNFEGRINPDVKLNYLASPPLVVAYALAGSMNFDFDTEPLGLDGAGQPIFLRDVWPSPAEVQAAIDGALDSSLFVNGYADVFRGDARWQALDTPEGARFRWEADSTYVRKAPYLEGMTLEPAPVQPISAARVLLYLGDSVTTDHISPAGSIKTSSPAGRYLAERGVAPADFNSYGSRRGNHEVMVRGTFANTRLENRLLDGVRGGFTKNLLTGAQETVYDAALDYAAHGIPLVILAGKEYGSGSSRDWAAKGTSLLGVRAVVAQSFERIHRSNLIGMGVLPLEFPAGESAASLGLDGSESFDIDGVTALSDEGAATPDSLPIRATRGDGGQIVFDAKLRIDTPGEAAYFRHGGILQYVLRGLARQPV